MKIPKLKLNLTLLLILVIIVLAFVLTKFFSKTISSNEIKIENFDNIREPIDSHIQSIYYINLENREDRKNDYLNNFSPKDEHKIHRIRGHYYPENGAVGCLMSHINALNAALKDPHQNILICEDDFVIEDMNYCNKMLKLFFENVKNWDVVMLGHNTIDAKDTGIQTDHHEKIIKIIDSQTTSAYLVKKSYIPKLLKIYENDMQSYIKTGVWEGYYTDMSWKVLQPDDKWFAFEPSVGRQSGSTSDIETGVKKMGIKKV